MSNGNGLQLTRGSDTSGVQIFNSPELMERAFHLAKVMATSKSMVPADLRNEGDCLGIVFDSYAWQLNPFAVARKAYNIKGRLSYESQVLAAAINNSPDIDGDFKYEWFGDWSKVRNKFKILKNSEGKEYRVPDWKMEDEEGLGVRVTAKKVYEDTPITREVYLSECQTRNSTLWAVDPQQQICYTAQFKWVRLHTPHILLGAYTKEEAENMEPKDITPQRQSVYANEPQNESGPKDPQDPIEREVARLTLIAQTKGPEEYKKEWEKIGAQMRKNIGAKRHQEMKATAEGASIIDVEPTQVKEEAKESVPDTPIPTVTEIKEKIKAITALDQIGPVDALIDLIVDENDKDELINMIMNKKCELEA